ncbi:MAG TPA: hypothetical protein VGL56_19110 [Fimbriimonadaceae bacterium]
MPENDPSSTPIVDQRNSAFKSFQAFKKKQGIKKVSTAAAGAVIAAGLTGLTATTSSTNFPLLIENGTCSMNGGSKPGGADLTPDVAAANDLKNRYIAPDEADDIDYTATASVFTTEPPPGQATHLNQAKGADVQAYVVKVKPGGAETCNCQTPDQQWWDTHIYLSPEKGTTDLMKCFIVEVTPRFRLAGNSGLVGQTTQDLKTALKPGTEVEVTGWQFYDAEHKGSAATLNNSKAGDWRATCWEIHPVTDIEIVGGAQSSAAPATNAPTPAASVANPPAVSAASNNTTPTKPARGSAPKNTAVKTKK